MELVFRELQKIATMEMFVPTILAMPPPANAYTLSTLLLAAMETLVLWAMCARMVYAKAARTRLATMVTFVPTTAAIPPPEIAFTITTLLLAATAMLVLWATFAAEEVAKLVLPRTAMITILVPTIHVIFPPEHVRIFSM